MLQPIAPSMLPSVPKLIHSFDWAQTTLGSKHTWPTILTNSLSLILETKIPMVIYWGKNYITLYNDAYAHLIGPKHPALLGQPLSEIWPERKKNFYKIAQVIYQGENIKYISKYKKPDAPDDSISQEIEINFSPILDETKNVQGILSVITNVINPTLQTSESIEQLIGGLAHDFNTLLGGIIGNLELMKMRINQQKTDSLSRYIHAAQQSAAQATVITNQLLSFSRRQTLIPHVTDPNHALQALTDKFNILTEEYAKHPVPLCFDMTSDIWSVFCDPEQLQNALTNIFINACEAIHPSNGKINIKSHNISITHTSSEQSFIKPNDYIVITIEDNGIGMDPDTVKRAKDPFFTTKPLGKRAGLGLSMAYGFAKQSGGYLIIHSTPNMGTSVKLYLPRYHRPLVVEKFFINPQKNNHSNILMISQDNHLRMLVGENLEDLGYITTTTKTEKEANSLLSNNPNFHFIIIDSRTLIHSKNNILPTILENHPQLPILLITGYENHLIDFKNFLNKEKIFIIRQPITPSLLADQIKSIQEILESKY